MDEGSLTSEQVEIMDVGSLTSEQVETSAKSDGRRHHRHKSLKLVITVNTVEAGTDTITIVRNEDVTFVTVTLIMMTATL